MDSIQDDAPEAVIAFWREAGPALWFAKDRDFDDRFRAGFLAAHEAAAREESAFCPTPEAALARLLLLDQFPRNAFRGSARMYATDTLARAVAKAAIAAGQDWAIEPALRLFVYLPFAHSERLADQDLSVALVAGLGEPDVGHARRHHGIIRRFGRFPHRNPILGRATRPEEQAWLDAGGYAG